MSSNEATISRKQRISKFKRHRHNNSLGSVYSTDDESSVPEPPLLSPAISDIFAGLDLKSFQAPVSEDHTKTVKEDEVIPGLDSEQDFGVFKDNNSNIIDLYGDYEELENSPISPMNMVVLPPRRRSSNLSFPLYSPIPLTGEDGSPLLPNIEEDKKISEIQNQLTELSLLATSTEEPSSNQPPQSALNEPPTPISVSRRREVIWTVPKASSSMESHASLNLFPPGNYSLKASNSLKSSKSNRSRSVSEVGLPSVIVPGSCSRNAKLATYLYSEGLVNAKFPDCKIQIGEDSKNEGSVFEAHRMILTQSPVFAEAMENESVAISRFQIKYNAQTRLLTILPGPDASADELEMLQTGIFQVVQVLYGMPLVVKAANIVPILFGAILLDMRDIRKECFRSFYSMLQKARHKLRDSLSSYGPDFLSLLHQLQILDDCFRGHEQEPKMTPVFDCLDYLFLHSWTTSWFRFCIGPLLPDPMFRRLVSQWFTLEISEAKRFNNILRILTIRHAHLCEGQERLSEWISEYFGIFDSRTEGGVEKFKEKLSGFKVGFKNGVLTKDAVTMDLLQILCESVNLRQLDMQQISNAGGVESCIILESRTAKQCIAKRPKEYFVSFDLSHYDPKNWSELLNEEFILTPDPILIDDTPLQLYLKKDSEDDSGSANFGIFLKRMILPSQRKEMQELKPLNLKFSVFLSHSLSDIGNWQEEDRSSNSLLLKSVFESSQIKFKPMQSWGWVSDALNYSLTNPNSERNWISIKITLC